MKPLINNKSESLNADGLCLVHVTKFPTERQPNGAVYLQSTAQATGYKDSSKIRTSIHFTLNGPVSSHELGNWDTKGTVYIADYLETVALNGNPAVFRDCDTFFTPDVNEKLILENPFIINPSQENQKKIIEYNGHDVTFKSNNFTSEDMYEIYLRLNEIDSDSHPIIHDDNISEIAKKIRYFR